jgi:hypothetical protein
LAIWIVRLALLEDPIPNEFLGEYREPCRREREIPYRVEHPEQTYAIGLGINSLRLKRGGFGKVSKLSRVSAQEL